MSTSAIVIILAAGAGLALLVRSLLSVQTSIDRDDDVVAKDYAHEGQARDAMSVLEANGIASMLRGGGRVGVYSVIVRPDVVDEARRVLGRKPEDSRNGAA